MPDSPRLSVITSVYNSSDFLFDFFLDIKRQSIFYDCEFLILDANDKEDSEDFAIISSFLDLPNIKYKHIGKCSVYEAWNKGIHLSKSELISNWNTDDRRKWNSLETQVDFLENNKEVDLCYGNLKVSKVPNQKFEDCDNKASWPTFEGTLENQLNHNSPHCFPIWRKSVHERFGFFDESFFSAADYDMWFRIIIGGGKLKKMDEFTGLYFLNELSISRNPDTLRSAIKEVSEVKSKYKKYL